MWTFLIFGAARLVAHGYVLPPPERRDLSKLLPM